MEKSEKVCLVLELGSGKYWVAETGNPSQYEKDCKEKITTTAFICKYEFVKVIEQSNEPWKILIITLMRKYGVDNVRGTHYPKEILPAKHRKEINVLLRQTTRPIPEASEEQFPETPTPARTPEGQLSETGSNVASLFTTISNNSPNYNVKTKFNKPQENLLASILDCEKKTLYVLKLKQGRYYVGSTERDVNIRIQEHIDGQGPWFTKKFEVKECIYTGPCLTNFDEDNMTEALMFALGSKGVELVRGGSYSTFTISDIQRNTLQRKFDHCRNACLGCGKTGHYIGECLEPKFLECTRCGARGHDRMDCYVKIFQDGKQIL